ncbi:Txe/YoeB family addiction module toxin [soil metagenome]
MSRDIKFTAAAWNSYTGWQGQDRKTLKRINVLIEAARRTPFDGIGKPEPLAGNLTGFWSRRIDEANRLVYAFEDDELIIITCRFHYED